MKSIISNLLLLIRRVDPRLLLLYVIAVIIVVLPCLTVLRYCTVWKAIDAMLYVSFGFILLFLHEVGHLVPLKNKEVAVYWQGMRIVVEVDCTDTSLLLCSAVWSLIIPSILAFPVIFISRNTIYIMLYLVMVVLSLADFIGAFNQSIDMRGKIW
ncbi:MAG: hypothetical protein QW348_06030 [Ignisphaera sp.]